jgi:hypothetical protein
MTTSSMRCTQILEVMMQPLTFSTLSPLGPILTQVMPTMKGTEEDGESLRGKDILPEEVRTF